MQTFSYFATIFLVALNIGVFFGTIIALLSPGNWDNTAVIVTFAGMAWFNTAYLCMRKVMEG